MESVDMDGRMTFKDPVAERICIETWGRDGRFTYADAASIEAIGVLRESDDPYTGSVQAFDEDEYDERPQLRSFEELACFTGLRTIGSYCFAGCDRLERIALPESLEEIRDYAFVFNDALRAVRVPDGVRSIGKRAFACCSSLKEISIPAGATVGVGAFDGCPEDLRITVRGEPPHSPGDDVPFADPVTRDVCIRAWGHDGRFTFADAARVTEMGEHRHSEERFTETSFVFDEIEASDRPRCESFDELRFFENLRLIDSYSFTQCEELRSIVLPESVEEIGDMAFAFCTGLRTIRIPDSVRSIARWAFRGCSSLQEVDMPAGTVLGKGVFDDCGPDLRIVRRLTV